MLQRVPQPTAHRKPSLFLALLLVASLPSAAEQDRPYHYADAIVVSPLLGRALLDDERLAEDDTFRGLAARYHLSAHWALEGWMGTVGSRRAGEENTLRGIGAQYFPRPAWRLQPQFGLGLAQMHYVSPSFNSVTAGATTGQDPVTQDQSAAVISHGWAWHFNSRLSLAAEVRALYDYEDGATDSLATLALQWQFGRRPSAPKKLFYDSDADGIADEADYCPGTAVGSAVDEFGCPRPEQLVLRYVLGTVNFHFDSARLTDGAEQALDQLVAALGARAYSFIQIEGHADLLGSSDYNRELALARARSVEGYLRKRGLAGVAIESVGYGETWPLAGSAGEAARARNRRVEIKVWNYAPEVLAAINTVTTEHCEPPAPAALALQSSFSLADSALSSRRALVRWAQSQRKQAQRWLLLGYADAHLNGDYGPWLAARRALAVRSELMTMGITPDRLHLRTCTDPAQLDDSPGFRRAVSLHRLD